MSLNFVGTITSTKGFKGKLYVSDVPSGLNVVNKGTKVHVGYSASFTKEYTIQKWDKINTGAVLLLEEVTTDVLAKELKEQAIYAHQEHLKDPENEEYFQDVTNYEVFNIENGEKIGDVVEIWELPANNVWLVETKDGELPVPVVDVVVKSIDYNEHKIHIFLMPGLLDLIDNGKGDKEEKDKDDNDANEEEID